MAIPRKSEVAVLVPIHGKKEVLEVTKGAKSIFDAALKEYNEASGEDADLPFLIEPMMLDYAATLKSEAARIKKENGGNAAPAAQKPPKPELHAVQQSA